MGMTLKKWFYLEEGSGSLGGGEGTAFLVRRKEVVEYQSGKGDDEKLEWDDNKILMMWKLSSDGEHFNCKITLYACL